VTREIALADLATLKLAPYNVEDCRLSVVAAVGQDTIQNRKSKIANPKCLRLDYYFPQKPTGDYAWTELIVDQPLPTPPRAVGIRLDARGSLCEAAFRVVDATGETFQMKLTYQMRSYGWTLVSRPLTFLGASWGGNADAKIDYPARLHSLLIDTSRRGRDSVLLKDIVIEE
jgi:hypothetical protein